MTPRILNRRAATLLHASFVPLFVALLVPCFTPVGAQDSLRLGAMQARAASRDPRARQLDLMASQSRLRLDNLATEQRPSLSLEGLSQYQSDVTRFPGTLPGGLRLPTPAHDTYDARLVAQQRLYDPSLAPRRAVEHAQLAESESRLRVAMFGVRQQVNDLFFVALRVQAQRAELEHGIADLESQLTVVNARVREGSALPGESLTIRAELARRRQGLAELDARRRSALEVLGSFTGVPLDSASVFSAPDLANAVRSARDGMHTLRSRAEFEQFARTRELLSKQETARSAQDKPRVSAFGRAGYGRPGLNPLNDAFDRYWLVGVQLQWTPWNWRGTEREREVIALERQVVAANEQYFTESLQRGVADDLATIDRLAAIVVSDDEIVSLREQIAAETAKRFTEGVVTSAEFVDRETDVLSARTARALHRVELAQAQAHFLTMLGIEVRQ